MRPHFNEDTALSEETESAVSGMTEFLTVYDDGKGDPLIFTVKYENGSFSAKSIKNAQTLSFYKEGIYTLSERTDIKNYICFSEKTFQKTADILKIMVYNEEKGKYWLLNGRQAAERMSEEFFTTTCMDALNKAEKSTLDEIFDYLTDDADCYLDYTEYHDVFER